MTISKLPLEGRAALVTGAGRGLGRAYVLALAQHGAAVAVNSRSEESVAAVVSEITRRGGRAIGCAGDLEEQGVPEAVVDATLRAFGHLEVLVNNAGGDTAPSAPFAAIGRAERDAMMRKNFDTAWDVTAAAWAHLAAAGSGRIVLTSSTLAFYGQPGLAHYAAAKGAIVGLARTLAAEGREHGLTVNVLNPIANTGERKVFVRWPGSSFPVEHVAAALAWMTSERCTVTGQILSIGGTWARPGSSTPTRPPATSTRSSTAVIPSKSSRWPNSPNTSTAPTENYAARRRIQTPEIRPAIRPPIDRNPAK